MVGANTFRNPGLTAKLATTLDHVSGGRAVLGIGGAWFEREHDAFGIDFGASPGERLDRLDESVMLMRRLLDGERFSHDGPDLHVPRRPERAATDPGRTSRSSSAVRGGARPCAPSRRAPMAGTRPGRSTRCATRSRPSTAHAADVGRDLATLEKTISFPIVLDDDAAEAPTADGRADGGQRRDEHGPRCRTWSGRPAEVADAIRPYRDLGFATVIVRMPAPYDPQTIERIGEVAAALER